MIKLNLKTNQINKITIEFTIEMSITVNLESVLFVLAILGCIALIFLIIVLKRLSSNVQYRYVNNSEFK